MPRSTVKQKKRSANKPGVALITGASRGIGAELAKQFAKGGYDLVLVARNAKQLRELAADLKREFECTVTVVPLDLGEPGAPQALLEKLAKKAIAIEVLVNNVGLLRFGDFIDIPREDYQQLINLNIAVLTELTYLFIGPMRQRGSGRVLNVASLSGFMPVPEMAVYAATKAYVLSLSEALHEEFKETGVTVTATCPGFVSTDMVAGAEAHSELHVPALMLIPPEQVAKEGYNACMRGQVVHVPGLTNKLGARFSELQPRTVRRLASGMLSRFLSRDRG